ncbi:hypothetical protein V8G54_019049, partial [Vigna mungo]
MKKLNNKIFLVENNDKNGIFSFEFQQKIVKSRMITVKNICVLWREYSVLPCVSVLLLFEVSLHYGERIEASSYLKISAIIKVMAGRTLTVADANVVEVFFI